MNGLTLRWRRYKGGRPIPTACGYWNENGVPRQTSASLVTNPVDVAIENCLAPRAAAGFDVPSMATARRQVRAFVLAGPR